MGGCTALGILNDDNKTVTYWMIPPMNLDEISNYLDYPLNAIKDASAPLAEGICTAEVFKSPDFQEEHDIIWSVIFMAGSIVCHNGRKIAILRNRQGLV